MFAPFPFLRFGGGSSSTLLFPAKGAAMSVSRRLVSAVEAWRDMLTSFPCMRMWDHGPTGPKPRACRRGLRRVFDSLATDAGDPVFGQLLRQRCQRMRSGTCSVADVRLLHSLWGERGGLCDVLASLDRGPGTGEQLKAFLLP